MSKLDEIMRKHGTDKSSKHHGYAPTYERYFEPLRNEPIVLLELGFGGYEYPNRGGEGAKTWAEYFHNGFIITTDIHDKNIAGHQRTEFFKVSQTDEKRLKEIIEEYRQPDIIIDDASHKNDLTIQSFEILFPLLKRGGYYVCEDIETAYGSNSWGEGGNPNPFQYELITTMSFFQALTHQLNAQYFAAEYRNKYADMIDSIHFHRNMVAIKKK